MNHPTHPTRSPTERLPLHPTHFLILLSVADRPLHGYGIVKKIAEDSDGAVELHPGNLYRYLHALEEEGLIRPSEPPDDEDDPRRAYVAITRTGRRLLELETRRLKALVSRAERRSLGHESTR